MIRATPIRWIAILTLLIASCGCTTTHRFDPLAHDNEWDHHVDPHNLTIMAFGTSLAYTLTPPADPQECLAFFLDNIDRTSSGTYSPNGESITPITLRILQMGVQTLPLTRAAFLFSLKEPKYYKKAQHLAYVLGRFRDTTMFEDLALAALNHPDYSVRNTCTWALPRTGGKKAIPVLIELLYEHPTLEDEWINQSAAAEALSVSTGLTFLEQVYWEPQHEPAGVREDLTKWREWSKSYQAGNETSMSPAVAGAVVQRQRQRLKKSGGRDRTTGSMTTE